MVASAAVLHAPTAAAAEPETAAKAAGLRYVSDADPGIRRKRAGKGFSYARDDGRPVKDAATLRRIRALAIPPAWTDVWICPDERGHAQATGRDARGRKQYRYHPEWRKTRDDTKYARMIAFGEALPLIRARVDEDLRRPGLPREKVLATIVRLLESTLMRVGNEEYAKQNGSYGLTTLRSHHAKVERGTLRLRFRGKAGKYHDVDVDDPHVARIVRRSQELPGQELFQYLDEAGEPRSVGSEDVNDYLREITSADFTAKDFRTWAGTMLATLALQEFEVFDSKAQAKRNVVQAIERVAERLGNTPSVCRKCYVHPEVVLAYLDGDLARGLRRRVERKAQTNGLDADEGAVLALLRRRLAVEAKAARKPRGSRPRARPRKRARATRSR